MFFCFIIVYDLKKNINKIKILRYFYILFLSETPAEFTHKLSDIEGKEGEMIELSCTLSRPDVKVRWLKNRKPLTPSDRIKILCDRYRHVLQIMDAIPEDEGEYTIEVTENIESSAALKIRGIFI
jgi:obscurin-RhoGEF protein